MGLILILGAIVLVGLFAGAVLVWIVDGPDCSVHDDDDGWIP